MAKPTIPEQTDARDAARAERLAAQLRGNLHRRKAQAREWMTKEGDSSADGTTPALPKTDVTG